MSERIRRDTRGSQTVGGFRIREVTGDRYTGEPQEVTGDTSTEPSEHVKEESVDSQQQSEQEYESDDSDNTETGMGSNLKDIVFTGKASELDQLELICKLEFATNSKYEDEDAAQAAFFAKRFRGKALTWLVRQQKQVPSVLENYTQLVQATKLAFGLSDELRKANAAKILPSVRQSTSVQAYVQTFENITALLSLDDTIKQTFFIQGLKLNVKEALIASGTEGRTYAEIAVEAQRLDEELYSARKGRGNFGQRGKQDGKRGGTGSGGSTIKCYKCGQFGHKQKACPTGTTY